MVRNFKVKPITDTLKIMIYSDVIVIRRQTPDGLFKDMGIDAGEIVQLIATLKAILPDMDIPTIKLPPRD